LDVDMPGWTGNEKWGTSNESTDTRSNEDWSLQLFNHESLGHSIYVGRISGKYKGIGFMYWFLRPIGDWPNNTIVCDERTENGKTFDGADGDYCHKIMGGTKYNNVARHYTLPY
ncbi:MAG: hypothetical protein J6Q05_03910, partial [Elusimicrobiaceae bacterium]|nr:hypothetical protein [Elusimicrobiaceae bacterium]